MGGCCCAVLILFDDWGGGYWGTVALHILYKLVGILLQIIGILNVWLASTGRLTREGEGLMVFYID